MNLAYVLLRLERFREAEPEARTAVSLDPANPTAQFLFGFLLAQRTETRNRAIEHLEYAARTMPEAKQVLARVHEVEQQEASGGQ
jgi:hypothetical protein